MVVEMVGCGVGGGVMVKEECEDGERELVRNREKASRVFI